MPWLAPVTRTRALDDDIFNRGRRSGNKRPVSYILGLNRRLSGRLTTATLRAGAYSGRAGPPRIEFKWGGKAGPGTRQAHRLIRLGTAKSAGTQDAAVEGLFDAYYAREQNKSERNMPREVAVAAGIDVVEADAWLNSDKDAGLVDEAAGKNREILKGSGVTALVVRVVHQLNGVQYPADLLEVFIRVREDG
ncbi:hypothetical protein F4818DRAFT_454249 [Hypoxylon cercidicola]|nr:hypothetical protein F4818DRAFT_454249 [Hypoxylon cercidicola]